MKRHTNAILAVITALLLGGSALAQQATRDKPAPAAQEKPMSMADMMKGCQEHCQATTKSIDQVTNTIDEAMASNDPAKMRAALVQARKPLVDMKQHMNMCMSMMKMMGNVPGK